jgi:hypothetical protein
MNCISKYSNLFPPPPSLSIHSHIHLLLMRFWHCPLWELLIAKVKLKATLPATQAKTGAEEAEGADAVVIVGWEEEGKNECNWERDESPLPPSPSLRL